MKKSELRWSCLSNCGACCYLSPDSRLEALKRLDTEQTKIYLEMVGDDGWCVNYDSSSRKCNIYNERPDFCRVSNLYKLFDFDADDTGAFAITCCRQQIKSLYGGRSKEIRQFEKKLRHPKSK